jgi:carboxypeptidase Q
MRVPKEVSDRLLAECLGRPQAYEQLGRLCDSVGGRTSGAESGRRAEEWAFSLLAEWGLENVRYEEFPVTAWTRGTLEASVLEPAGWPLTALAHGNAPRQADITAPVLDVGHAEREDFERLKEDVRGKIALCDEGASEGRRTLHRTEKLGLAVEYGAVGLMILSSASGGLPRTGVCHPDESPIPSLGISQEDGERLKRLMRGGAQPVARMTSRPKVLVQIRMTNALAPGMARNVLADLPGSVRPEEVVLAGAHLDSWDIAQGATDNGLGAAIVLEMTRALAALEQRPRRTLRFALWAAEEVGLFGSREYARRNADELPRLAAVMNFDMTGDPYGYWIPGRKEPGELLRGLARQLAPLGMREEFAHKAGLHSDHQPFMLAGVPVVCLMGKLEGEGGRYYHSVGDTFEKVSQAALCRAACVGAHTMFALANVSELPFTHLDPVAVRAMIDEANLYEALVAEGYDGPAMKAAGKNTETLEKTYENCRA